MYYKMSSLAGFFFGIITILIIFMPFWYLAQKNAKIGAVYNNLFCNNVNTNSVNA
jgi:hypothetical protein